MYLGGAITFRIRNLNTHLYYLKRLKSIRARCVKKEMVSCINLGDEQGALSDWFYHTLNV